MTRKAQVIRKALQATDWKTEHGYCLQIGIDGHVDDVNQIAEWAAEHRDFDTFVVDSMRGCEKSVLDGLKNQVGAHFKAPPTMHGRCKIYPERMELHFPVLFLHVATEVEDDVDFVLDGINTGTVIFGSFAACTMLLELANREGQPLYYAGEHIAIRIA